MFILLGVYLGGLLVSLIASVELVIAGDCDLREEVAMIIASLIWPITDLVNLIFKIRDMIRRKQN